ncbi:MAG: LamG domain-containing protein, partial [Planctomycetaceae bacterium]
MKSQLRSRNPLSASIHLTLPLLISLVIVRSSPAADRPARVTDGLVVLYTFDRLENGVIPDRSGVGDPVPLRIDKPQGVRFRNGRMIVSSSVTIASDGPARKVIQAAKRTNELTVEAWLRPLESQQTGPARIFSLSHDTGQRNFTLGQDSGRYDVRLRTTSTSDNGTPSTAGPEDSISTSLTHVVFTRAADGATQLFADGKKIGANTIAGDFGKWNDEFRLSIANEVTGDRPWLGEL